MRSRFYKGLVCALLCISFCVTQVRALSFDGLQPANPNFGEGEVLESDGDNSNIKLNTPYDDSLVEEVAYTPVELKDATKDFFATLDGDVTLTLISGQKDFADGIYVEYYNDFYTDNKNYYYSFINTLKAISELNEYVKLEFVDPFSTDSYSFFEEYESYDLKYGDLFVTCYSNFDGAPKTRRTVIELEKLFKTKEDQDGKQKISGIDIEKVLVGKLESLRHYRNINVAYITDLCSEDNLKYLKAYLNGRRYNFDNVTLKEEKLNGYDMVLIAAPIRDVTLEEIVLLNTFLDNGGNFGKTVMYFCPEQYVELPNLHSFLRKWGIAVEEKYKLVCNEKEGYFSKNSQVIAEAVDSDYFKDFELDSGKYIMDNCTPLTIANGVSGIKVKTLLKTKSKDITPLLKNKQLSQEREALIFEEAEFPLITLSQKNTVTGAPSSVVICSSVDFITTYLARQTPKIDTDFKGELNGNLQLTTELLEKLNHHHRSVESGLGKYAVGLADMGYDTTSGLETKHILQVAISSVAVFILLFVGLLVLSARNHKKKSLDPKTLEGK